jgi:hypothetical protein
MGGMEKKYYHICISLDDSEAFYFLYKFEIIPVNNRLIDDMMHKQPTERMSLEGRQMHLFNQFDMHHFVIVFHEEQRLLYRS